MVTLKQLIYEMENVGEVSLGVIAHTVEKDGSATVINNTEPIAFVLDQPKKRKKARAACLQK